MWSRGWGASPSWCGEWQQISWTSRGGPTQEETPSQPDYLHHLPTARAGTSFWEIPLPWCVQSRRAGHEGQSPRSTSAGTTGVMYGHLEWITQRDHLLIRNIKQCKEQSLIIGYFLIAILRGPFETDPIWALDCFSITNCPLAIPPLK